MTPFSLLPARTDIQGALEHAYQMLRPRGNALTVDRPEYWAVQGSLALGPVLWLTKTYERNDFIGWIHDIPTAEHAKVVYDTLIEQTPRLDDLNNVQRRLQPFLAQVTPTAHTLAQWLPAALADLPNPVFDGDNTIIEL